MHKYHFPRRAVAAAVLLLSSYAIAGQVSDLKIVANDAGVEVRLDAELGTIGRSGITRDSRHFVVEIMGVTVEKMKAIVARSPKPGQLVSDVYVLPLGADGARLVLALAEGAAVGGEQLATQANGWVQKVITLSRSSAAFDLSEAQARIESNVLNISLRGASRFAGVARQTADDVLTIDFEQLNAARAEPVLKRLVGQSSWLKSVKVDAVGQGSKATLQFSRAIELEAPQSSSAVGQAQLLLKVKTAPELTADGISGVSLKGFAAETTDGAATIKLLSSEGLVAEAVVGENRQELRLSLRGVNRKRASELVGGFRSAHPDVLGATVVSGDQRSSVVAFQLARPMRAEPQVQSMAGSATLVRLDGVRTASAAPGVAAVRPAAVPAGNVTTVAAKPMVLAATDPVAPTVNGPAAVSATLSMSEALQLAEERDPSLSAARFELRAQEEAIAQARSRFLPRVSLDGQVNRVTQGVTPLSGGNGLTDERNYPTRDLSLSITQPLIRMTNRVQMEQAEVAVEQARLAFAASEQDLMVRLTAAYLNVLAGQDAVNLSRAEREALEKQYQLALTRQRSGLANVTEVSDTEARFAVSRAREIEAANSLADARMGLKEIIGADVNLLSTEVKAFEPVLPQPQDPQAWQAAALRQNLSLRLRELASEIAELEIKKQRAGYAPNLDLVVSASKGHQGQNANGGVFSGGFDSTNQSVGVRLNWPLFEGGMTQSLVREATARLSKAQQEAEAERLKAERQAGGSLLAVTASARKIDALGVSLSAQETALMAKTRGVQAGLFSVVQVADAYRLMYAAKREFLQARYDYLLNRIKLKQSIGTLSRDDVKDVAEMLK